MENENRNFQTWAGIRETFGEILPNGVVYEAVQSRSGRGVELLRWQGENYEIARQFREDDLIYTAGFLHPSVLEATRLVREPAEYGDALTLFRGVVDLFCHYMGLSLAHAIFLVQVAFASWFPDCCARPVTICISGPNMDQIMALFRMLHVFCRRPIMTAQLNVRLPLSIHPTLLVNASPVSAAAAGFWRASNYRGTVVPGPRGAMCNISCAKLVFCEKEAAGRAWGPEAIHIGLVPTTEKLPPLTQLEEGRLAAEYLPKLLLFRLRNVSSLFQPDISSPSPAFVELASGGSLPACLAEDPEVRKALKPLLEAHKQDSLASRALNPNVAIVESVWTPMHKEKEISTAEIAKRVGALLRDRGETWE